MPEHDTIPARYDRRTHFLRRAKRCIKLDDGVTGEEIADARRRIERFREADFAGIGQRWYARRDIHSLPKVVRIFVEGHGNRRTTMRSDLQDDARITMLAIVAEFSKSITMGPGGTADSEGE